MIGQKKRHSFLEALINISIGLGVSLSANIIVMPMLGIKADYHQIFWYALILTVISVIRSYSVRRMFNFLHTRGIL